MKRWNGSSESGLPAKASVVWISVSQKAAKSGPSVPAA
jgi:hypothetical protein